MFRGEKVYLDSYLDGDGENFAEWQWDNDFINGICEDVAHPYRAQEWEAMFADGADSNENIMFSIRSIADEQLIGFVGLSNLRLRAQRGELGIGIPQVKDRHLGYGKEALTLILEYAFNHLNLHKVTLNVYAFNTAAIKAYEAVGFIKEGVNREALPKDGQWYDEYQYGLLASEWRDLKQK